jgi:membrane carboxypeptidase/penicillin-binding protein PbpC
LFLNNNPVPLQEGGSTLLEAGIGTYTVSITHGNYSEINWFLNGALIPQWSNSTSVVLTRRIPGLYLVSVEATLAGEKNTGRHFFVIEGAE